MPIHGGGRMYSALYIVVHIVKTINITVESMSVSGINIYKSISNII